MFDSVVLLNRNANGKREEIAIVHVSQELPSITHVGKQNNTITLPDCENHFPELFSLIASRRKQKIFDNLYIPESSETDKYITYGSFLSCALSFESEYARTHPSKAKEKKEAALAKELTQLSVEQIQSIFDAIQSGSIQTGDIKKLFYSVYNTSRQNIEGDLQNSSSRQEFKKCCNQILEAVSKVDYSLGDKYRRALKEYDSIVSPVIARRVNNLPLPAEAGERFASFRNSIAHGEPKEFTDVDTTLFFAARCMIYTMILQQAGFDDIEISHMLKKVF